MPNYDYRCPTCGPFTAMRSMARFQDPCACPVCGVEASRTLLSAPALAGMGATRRSVLASSERNAGSQGSTSAAHPAGCGCCLRRWPMPSALSSAGGRVFSASGPLRQNGR